MKKFLSFFLAIAVVSGYTSSTSYAALNTRSICLAYDYVKNEQSIHPSTVSQKNRNIGQNLDLNSAVEKIAQCDDDLTIDWEYMNHLDLAIGAVAEKIGLMKNFRFFNGFIDKISVKDKKRQFIYDSGKGSASVMTILFPSPTGYLEVEHKLNLTPVQVAELIGIVYSLRRDKIALGSEKDIKSHISEIKNLAATCNKNQKVRTIVEAKQILQKYVNTKPKRVTTKQKLKEEKAQKILREIDTYIIIEELLKQRQNDNKSIKKIIYSLLSNISVMVNEQERLSDDKYSEENFNNDNPQLLPLYMTERILLCYFVKKFNSNEDVENFYNKVKQLICLKTDEFSVEEQKNKRETTLSQMKILHETYQSIVCFSSIPYDSMPIENGSAQKIRFLNSEKSEAVFEKTCFADCADTSVRHVLNFMTYDRASETFKIPGCDIFDETLSHRLEEIVDAIQTGEKFPVANLLDRIRLFYMYQDKLKVNYGDTITRSLWNYVISGVNMKDCGGYEVAYKQDASENELSSGLVNFLKICYNIAFAILDGNKLLNPQTSTILTTQDKQNKDALLKSKNAIDLVIKDLSDDGFDEHKIKINLKSAYEKVLKLFNPTSNIIVSFQDEQDNEVCIKKIKKHTLDLKKNFFDFLGKIKVSFNLDSKESFSFHISHSIRHSKVFYKIKKSDKFIKKHTKNLDIYDVRLLSWYYGNISIMLDNFDWFFINFNSLLPENMYTQYMYRACALKYFEILMHNIRNNEEDTINFINDMDIIDIFNNNLTLNESTSMLEYIASSMIQQSKIATNESFIKWYAFNIYKKYDVLTAKEFELKNKEKLEKYKKIQEITTYKSSISDEDIDFIKSFPLEELDNIQGTNILTELIQKQMTPNQFERLIDYTGISTEILNTVVEKFSWDKVEVILKKMEWGFCGNRALLVILRTNPNLIVKYRHKFNFNDFVFINRNSELYNVFSYIHNFINPKIAKFIDPHCFYREALMSQKTPIRLHQLDKLFLDDFLCYLGNSCLLEKCFDDLPYEDLTKFLTEKFHVENFKRIAIKVLINSKSLNSYKLKILLELVPEYTLLHTNKIIKHAIQDRDKELLKMMMNKSNEFNYNLQPLQVGSTIYTMEEYLETITQDPEMIKIISPHKDIIEKLRNTHSIGFIPRLYILRYFHMYGGRTSIMSAAIDCLSDRDFQLFLDKYIDNNEFTRFIYSVIAMLNENNRIVGYRIMDYAIKTQQWQKYRMLLSKIQNSEIRAKYESILKTIPD